MNWKSACCAFAAILSVALTGCSASIEGAPDRLIPVTDEAQYLAQVSGPARYLAYAQATGTDKRELRNQIVFSRMYAIDLAYSRYEMRLTRERQSTGFLGTLAQLGISTSGTLVGGEQAKTILHAAESGVTGLKEGYEKNILVERTIAVLQQQMRAQRQIVKAKIIERLVLGADAYPLEFALSDLEEYYRAGTITGALIGASQDAGSKLDVANAVEEAAVSVRFAESDLNTRISDFWRSNPENKGKVERWLVRNRVPAGAPLFVNSEEYTAEKLRMIQELDIP